MKKPWEYVKEHIEADPEKFLEEYNGRFCTENDIAFAEYLSKQSGVNITYNSVGKARRDLGFLRVYSSYTGPIHPLIQPKPGPEPLFENPEPQVPGRMEYLKAGYEAWKGLEYFCKLFGDFHCWANRNGYTAKEANSVCSLGARWNNTYEKDDFLPVNFTDADRIDAELAKRGTTRAEEEPEFDSSHLTRASLYDLLLEINRKLDKLLGGTT